MHWPGIAACAILAACGGKSPAPSPAPPTPQSPAVYVGAAACASCHQAETAAWAGSHHQLAMQEAGEGTVLGNFSDAAFRYAGVTSKFFRRDGHFYVRTDGPNGDLADFQISYTFGVAPLQQYLVQFPDGRLQALSIAWDARPGAQGGQRWFHLYPDQKIDHASPLHWTKPSQNWNFMCAECHSTNLRGNYDSKNHRFATTWTDISVGCEACHGPGSNHLAWARASPRAPDLTHGLVTSFEKPTPWLADARTGAAHRSVPRSSDEELQTCAICHSRRAQLTEGHVPGQPLAHDYLPTLLRAGLYQADGQMQDEVYNYGSFLQSKMYANGVSCGDCHEPHSAKLRAQGNALCTSCHSTARYDAASHHHHEATSPGAACAACHMPLRNYMVVDPRHDHSFRIPRPDLSTALNTKNACTDCHQKQSALWAAAAVERWFGASREGFQTFGPALYAARTERRDAAAQLRKIADDSSQPAMVRATALAELAPYLAPPLIPLLDLGLHDADPLVRLGALDGLANLPIDRRWETAAFLLDDPAGAVRMLALPFLLPAADESHLVQLQPALEEYLASQRSHADRADAHYNIGLIREQQRDAEQAEAEYRAALVLDPQFVPARINLADLYRSLGRESDSETALRDGLAVSPDDASVHHALGLALVRAKQMAAGTEELRRAARLAPESARYAYVYAVALNSLGKGAAALGLLRQNEQQHPSDKDTLFALVDLLREQGDSPGALHYAKGLAELLPDDPSIAALLTSLQPH